MGVSNFSKTITSRAQDYEGTYYGEPSDAETLVSMGYSGGTFIELIQPVSGNSMFQDYEIGVMTELMGITEEGEEQVLKMKIQMS